jgi:hypothetical protein
MGESPISSGTHDGGAGGDVPWRALPPSGYRGSPWHQGSSPIRGIGLPHASCPPPPFGVSGSPIGGAPIGASICTPWCRIEGVFPMAPSRVGCMGTPDTPRGEAGSYAWGTRMPRRGYRACTHWEPRRTACGSPLVPTGKPDIPRIPPRYPARGCRIPRMGDPCSPLVPPRWDRWRRPLIPPGCRLPPKGYARYPVDPSASSPGPY